MNSKNVFIGGAVVLGGVALWKYYQKTNELINSLVITPAGLDVDTTHILSPKFYVILEINNPTATDVTISHVYGLISLNGAIIGSVNNYDRQLIKSNSYSKLKLNVSINTLNTLVELVKMDLSSLDLKFAGYLTANNVNQDIQIEFKNKNKIAAKKQINPFQAKAYYLNQQLWELVLVFKVKNNISKTNLNGKAPAVITGQLIGRNADGSDLIVATIKGMKRHTPEVYKANTKMSITADVFQEGHSGWHIVYKVVGVLDNVPFIINFG